MKVSGATDVGQERAANEDSILLLPELGVFAVADGMGGHRGGKVASQMATGELSQRAQGRRGTLTTHALREALENANLEIHQAGEADTALQGMGTTFTAIAIHEGVLSVAHVGDSRAYLRRNGRTRQLTQDHRAIQPMIDDGSLSETEARSHPLRNVLTRSIGVDENVEVDVQELELRSGDRILLCSDGLSDMLEEQELLAEMKGAGSPEELAQRLVQQANAAGGHDNISVIVVDMEDSDF